MNDLTMIWNEVISMLELQLNRIQLKNWIQPLTPISLEDDVLLLDCTSAFIYSMVDKKYRKDIQRCISYICEEPVEVALIHPGMSEDSEKIRRAKNRRSSETGNAQKFDSSTSESSHNDPPSEPFQIQNSYSREVAIQRSFLTEPSESLNGNGKMTARSRNLSRRSPSQEREYERESFEKSTFPPDAPPFSENVREGETMETEVSRRIQEKNRRLEQQRRRNGYTSLNPKYTMDSFVRGASNDFAYATAKAVIREPGRIYNPLFIYGLSGLGKTHLMQAIAHEILNTNPENRVLYITSENFMNEMIAVIENGTNAEKENFRHKYRSIDVLLIDDIQFIAGKKATMEEVFHTFNDLKEAGKQIVLSADKPPRELKNLEDRLVTRFEGGMTVDIQQPDFETRVAILNHKMKEESLDLPQYIIELIADHITANIRELEGALLRVLAYFRYKEGSADLSKEEALSLAREALKLEERSDAEITLDEIILRVAEYYHLKAQDMTSKSRQAAIARPRQVAMYLCRELTNESLVAIGNAFSRDHTTIMHAVDKIAKTAREEETMRNDLESLTSQLKHT